MYLCGVEYDEQIQEDLTPVNDKTQQPRDTQQGQESCDALQSSPVRKKTHQTSTNVTNLKRIWLVNNSKYFDTEHCILKSFRRRGICHCRPFGNKLKATGVKRGC